MVCAAPHPLVYIAYRMSLTGDPADYPVGTPQKGLPITKGISNKKKMLGRPCRQPVGSDHGEAPS